MQVGPDQQTSANSLSVGVPPTEKIKSVGDQQQNSMIKGLAKQGL
jgi:hypothetical protein